MIQVDDLSRSLIAFEQISTLVIVVELSQSSWLAAGVVPGMNGGHWSGESGSSVCRATGKPTKSRLHLTIKWKQAIRLSSSSAYSSH